MHPLYNLFYTLKPIIPRRLQIVLRRCIARYKRKKYAHVWPIDPNAGTPPKGWPGWPEGKKFALVLSHDVDTQKGHDNVMKLVELEEKLGFRSTFNFVPERYNNSVSLHRVLREKGFGIGVHGLKHDGKLFRSKRIFEKRAVKINGYLKQWQTRGFSSPSMHHELEWLHALNIAYSTSTFDTDPFEPQPDGIGSVFPFYVKNPNSFGGYVEMPYTLPQDFTLFVILGERSIEIWKRKLDWIAARGGLALLNTHSDYMGFEGGAEGNEGYPSEMYIQFLTHIKSCFKNSYYHVLPNVLARFWKSEIAGVAN